MRNYNPEKYTRLVENSNNELLKTFMSEEKDFILNLSNIKGKIIIDLGAGYGRALCNLNNKFTTYYGIEINEAMYLTLKENESIYKNVFAINGDFTSLRQILKDYNINYNDVLFLLLQNTLGTIEGETQSLINELKHLRSSSSCEIVISFFKSSKLPTLGFEMFSELEEMIGIPDRQLCDFSSGIFRSKSGYEAKWWNNKEINSIIDQMGLQIASRTEKEAFCIYHLK